VVACACVCGVSGAFLQPFSPAWSLNVVLVDCEALHRKLAGRMLRKLGCSFALCEGIYDVRPFHVECVRWCVIHEGCFFFCCLCLLVCQVRRAIHESDRPFDVVLTEINLSRGADGRQLCAQLRDDGYNNPIIACTGTCGCLPACVCVCVCARACVCVRCVVCEGVGCLTTCLLHPPPRSQHVGPQPRVILEGGL